MYKIISQKKYKMLREDAENYWMIKNFEEKLKKIQVAIKAQQILYTKNDLERMKLISNRVVQGEAEKNTIFFDKLKEIFENKKCI